MRKSPTPSARAMDVLDVLGERDVGEELDRVSVERDRVKLLELLEALLLGGQKLHALACVPALFGRGLRSMSSSSR